MQTFPSVARRRAYGLVGFVALLAVIALAIGVYQQAFTPVVRVKLQADRSGLLLSEGADVRLRGLPVGEVRDVALMEGGDGVEIDVALYEEHAESIPADVTASLLPTTVFGNKFVNLQIPPGADDSTVADGEAIQAGSVIQNKEVTTEINNVFLGLQDVLTTVQPAKLNATIGAMARALDGRGSQFGDYLSRVNSYLERLNPHMPNVQKDITGSADVLDTYAKAAPDLLRTAENASKTSATLSNNAATLHAMLLDFTRTASQAGQFFGRLENPLVSAMQQFDPVLRLLANYSPEFTCLVDGLNENRKRISVFGTYVSGAQGFVSFLPGQEGYKYPRDLPKFVQGDGPDCFGLPFISREEYPPPRVRFDDGAQSVWRNPDARLSADETVNFYPDVLFRQLFGTPPEIALGKPLKEVLPR